MARTANRLTARGVAGLKAAGRHADGQGLYLSISENGGRRWVLLFQWNGKTRELGLGSALKVTLAEARERADAARRQVRDGTDPIATRKEAALATPTFGVVADALIASLSPGWRNPKHREQWVMTLTAYAAPLRPKPVDAITTEDVLTVLKPLWVAKPETAQRLRGRIERVLDAARVRGLRTGENPARWKGHLDHILPARRTLARGHHAALPIDELPAFMRLLSERQGVAAEALAFTILTAARSGEVFGLTWAEINLERALWTVPASRMKTGKEHRVPLSEPALAILRRRQGETGDLVFPGQRAGRPLSSMAFTMALRRMKRGEITPHGFRSTFRDWAAERTGFPHEVAEMALAHAIGSKTEAAYRRGDLFDKRRELMAAWGDFCAARRGLRVKQIK